MHPFPPDPTRAGDVAPARALALPLEVKEKPSLGEFMCVLTPILEWMKGKKILIHCTQGHSRSATLVSILLAAATHRSSPAEVSMAWPAEAPTQAMQRQKFFKILMLLPRAGLAWANLSAPSRPCKCIFMFYNSFLRFLLLAGLAGTNTNSRF